MPQATRETIKGVCSMATRNLLSELATDYERQCGRAVSLESLGGVDAARRVETGDEFDFVALAAPAIANLAQLGRVVAESRVDLARSRVAVAVPAGVRHPDLSSEQSVRDALLAAKRVGYSTGPSGQHLSRLLERWGMAGDFAPRLVQAPPGIPVAALLACGDADIGFQQLSELMNQPGIEVLGTLPSDIQEITVFSGAVCASSVRRSAAQALLAFCASPHADAVRRRHGMEA